MGNGPACDRAHNGIRSQRTQGPALLRRLRQHDLDRAHCAADPPRRMGSGYRLSVRSRSACRSWAPIADDDSASYQQDNGAKPHHLAPERAAGSGSGPLPRTQAVANKSVKSKKESRQEWIIETEFCLKVQRLTIIEALADASIRQTRNLMLIYYASVWLLDAGRLELRHKENTEGFNHGDTEARREE